MVLKDIELVSHKLQSHVNLIKITFTTNQHLFIVFDQVSSLAKHSSQHSQSRVQKIFVLIPRKFKQ